jgi:hypothetical protein
MMMTFRRMGSSAAKQTLGFVFDGPASNFFTLSRFDSFHREGTSVVPIMATVGKTQVSRRGEAVRKDSF